MSDEKIRIQKYISECGVMSRRAAEAEIIAGNVTVGGVRASLGDSIDPSSDTVEISGRRVGAPQRAVTVMLNKPAGYLTSVSDNRGRRCVPELVSSYGVRLNPAGRLDLDSEGLLLLSSDGELLCRLMHPRYSLPKIYYVEVAEDVGGETVRRLTAPMELDGYRLRPVGCRIISSSPHGSELEFTLHEGRNRQIRRMCAIAGLHVLRLRRIAVGRLMLGDLPEGGSRLLTAEELNYLYSSLGLGGEKNK